MYEHIANKETMSHYKISQNKKIWFVSSKEMDLQHTITQFTTSLSHKNKTLFNVKLYENEQKGDELIPKKLDKKAKSYLCGCYCVLNWQIITFNNIDSLLRKLPIFQFELDDIRLEGNTIKFQKNDETIVYNPTTQQMQRQYNMYLLNCYDREGRNHSLSYTKSLKKITINGISYSVDDLINFVDSSGRYVALATQKSIYIININSNFGFPSKFDVPNCIDFTWTKKGLYYLQSNGIIGKLESHQGLFNGSYFTASQTINSKSMTGNEYDCKRIVYHEGVVIGICFNNQDHRKIMLCQLNNCNIMREAQQFLKHELVMSAREEILYQNKILRENQITLVIITGEEGKVKKYKEFTFGCRI